MRILYLNHTGLVSGAERSLLELLAGLPRGVLPLLACPPGPLAQRAAGLGVPAAPIDEVEGGLRLHPAHTPRALAAIGRSALRARSLAAAARVDLVHANSTRAGLVAGLAARLGGAPALVHVRDCLPPSPVGRAVARHLSGGMAMIVANSSHTARSLGRSASGGAPVRVIANPVDTVRFDPSRTTRAAARAVLGLDTRAPVLGIVGQLTPWKGQDDGIRILARVRRTHPRACLLIAGKATFTARATRYDNTAYAARLRALAAEPETAGGVRFLGEVEDVPLVMRALDVLLVPSWEEPFGRAVVEAMAMGTCVIATEAGGPAEIITPGEDGILLPPRRPARWAELACELLADGERRRRLGGAGRRTALARFTRDAHVVAVVGAYEEALGGTSRTGLGGAVAARP